VSLTRGVTAILRTPLGLLPLFGWLCLLPASALLMIAVSRQGLTFYPSLLVGFGGIAWLLWAALGWYGNRVSAILAAMPGESFNYLSVSNLERLVQGVVTEHEAVRWLSDSQENLKNQGLATQLRRAAEGLFDCLKAESVELALVDQQTKNIHFSHLVGAPLDNSAQHAHSEAGVEGQGTERLFVQELVCMGTSLGSVRVLLPKVRAVTGRESVTVNIFAHQIMLLVLNSNFIVEVLRQRAGSAESSKARTGFLATLSHEIRGPLGIILSAEDLLRQEICGALTRDQKEVLAMIANSGVHLQQLINDVLDFARIESGVVNPKKEAIDLAPLLQDVANVVRGQALEKKHSLSFERGAGVEGFTISFDRQHLRQVLINLLTNAVKYTPDGGSIIVKCTAKQGEQAQKQVRISVVDNGIGIPEDQSFKVFSAFERVDQAYANSQEGTGLGMPYSKLLVESNGGQIGFLTEVGAGSEFWIDVDLVERDAALLAEVEQADSVKGNGDLILFVGSASPERRMGARYLGAVGFAVHATDEPIEALEFATDNAVALIIMDNHAVDGDGGRLLRQLRETRKVSRVPVMLLTTRGFAFEIEEYLMIGVDYCLAYPLTLTEMSQKARELIDGTSLC
jgi:signal transduction histidine kinase